MRATWTALTLLTLATSACSSSGSLWRQPVALDERLCAAAGAGWLGAPMAAVAYGKCKDELEKRGYVKVRPLSQEEIDAAIRDAAAISLMPGCAIGRRPRSELDAFSWPHGQTARPECVQELRACSSHLDPAAYGQCLEEVKARWQ